MNIFRKLIILSCAISFALSQECVAGETKKEVPPYKIAAIKAYLYFYQKGTFSENIIDNPSYGRGSLWNTIIGDGSVGSNAIGPSEDTMIVVDIVGNPRDFDPKRKLSFVAMESGKVKMERIATTHLFNETGHFLVAFWLYDTGCKPIVLAAKLLGQSTESKLEKKIDFECGE